MWLFQKTKFIASLQKPKIQMVLRKNMKKKFDNISAQLQMYRNLI